MAFPYNYFVIVFIYIFRYFHFKLSSTTRFKGWLPITIEAEKEYTVSAQSNKSIRLTFICKTETSSVFY